MAAPGTARPTLTEPPSGEVVFDIGGREVAHYVWRPELPQFTAPRPYLHPVRTLAGRLVTDARPHSHTHQLGISLAAPDIDGRNFWGGRTFVAGHGPAWLDDHGAQLHRQWRRRDESGLEHTIDWVDRQGALLLEERRTVECRPLTDSTWALGIRTALTNATGRPVTFRTPAALGRPGAGYGGIFWRGPAATGRARIRSAAGEGVATVHGDRADWLAVTGADTDHREWTMVFLPADTDTAGDRWFVRARDYLGVGSSLAWDRPLVLDTGDSLARHLITVVADGAPDEHESAALAKAARAAV